MAIVDLVVRDFRNIETVDLRFSAQLNLIFGSNGAGKTSLLEALHFLGRAQSFRTAHTASLIREGSSAFLLRGHVQGIGGALMPVGMQRGPDQLQVRMGGRRVAHLSELLPHFPFQVFTPESHRLLEGGPRYRRKYLDWGVFHVEPSFFPAWQRYSRALKQRNAALRTGARSHEVRLWDRELVESATAMDASRKAYLDKLLPALRVRIADLVGLETLVWDYRSGWSRKLDYARALDESIDGDRRQGFTRAGPHRADLLPMLDGQPAHERVSRGQQKQIAIALMLAQAAIYQEYTGRSCIFLVDDLASELDDRHRDKVVGYLRELGAQVFLTAIDPSAIDVAAWPEQAAFHVEHGEVLV